MEAALQTSTFEADYDRCLSDLLTMASKSSAFELTEGPDALYKFVEAAWPLVEPLHPFVGNWHLQRLCALLQLVYIKYERRVIINIPPGTAKSLVVNVFWPAWVWAKEANKRFLFASYGAHLSTRDNLRCRQLIESPWFQERWPVTMSEDQNAKTRYNTDKKGWRVATSVNGMAMGEHPDYIVIDDPTTAMQAESDTERMNANDWFDRTLSTRLGRNPSIVIIMQRLHKDDLSGHLLKRGGWTHVRWPMRYEKCLCKGEPSALAPQDRCPLHKADPDWSPDPRDPRTEPGELLFPSLFPEDKVKQMEVDLGAYGAAGQLQQRPSPAGGKLFKREWFVKFVDRRPDVVRSARGWDTGATEGGGDSTASVKIHEEWHHRLQPAMGHNPAKKIFESCNKFFLQDPINEKLGPAGVDALITATAKLDGLTVAQREEKEGGSAGKTVIDIREKALRKLMPNINYAGVQISGSKVTRCRGFRAACERGEVYLVGTPAQWEPFIKELCEFPMGDHDDYVDAASSAFNSVLLEEPPKKRGITWS